MFSRGNISEKARLITLPSVLSTVERDGCGCTAVDLYAGIGYFAFSYAKAGIGKVLCWDLNPWSTEGLRRGAIANKWKTVVVTDGLIREEDASDQETRLIVFNESNLHAGIRVEESRQRLPPIRHVNCGLLPTSRGSWETAVRVLAPSMGGWIHVHENFAVNDIEQKAEEVREAFQKLIDATGRKQKVEIELIYKVKSYAPGVMHWVIDVYIPPYTPS